MLSLYTKNQLSCFLNPHLQSLSQRHHRDPTGNEIARHPFYSPDIKRSWLIEKTAMERGPGARGVASPTARTARARRSPNSGTSPGDSTVPFFVR
jgi:hypothetical protein